MSIDAYMKKICNDTAVYWSTPVVDNFGAFTFTTPVEISCLWKGKVVLMRESDGREIVSKAKVYVIQDLDEHGMLFHGILDDLTSAQKSDPKTVSDAYEIKIFLKTPSIHLKNQFNRSAIL